MFCGTEKAPWIFGKEYKWKKQRCKFFCFRVLCLTKRCADAVVWVKTKDPTGIDAPGYFIMSYYQHGLSSKHSCFTNRLPKASQIFLNARECKTKKWNTSVRIAAKKQQHLNNSSNTRNIDTSAIQPKRKTGILQQIKNTKNSDI